LLGFAPDRTPVIRSNEEITVTPTHVANPSMVELHVRARAEYLEMPGMRLTLAQAARLFNLPPDVCAATLDALVGTGFLYRSGLTYIRADSDSRCV
jgi:hypothetical protein